MDRVTKGVALREVYTTKPTVREARKTLGCSQGRAMRAVNAFTDAEGERTHVAGAQPTTGAGARESR